MPTPAAANPGPTSRCSGSNSHRHNRIFQTLNNISAVVFALAVIGGAAQAPAQDSDTKTGSVDLVVRSDSGAKVTARADFAGSLLLKNDEQKTNQAVPLKVAANFKYEQFPAGKADAIRRYDTATAQITLNEKSTENKLGETNRQIAVRMSDRKMSRPVTYLSVSGVLKQIEQELLLVPGDPLVYGAMFSKSGVTTGTRWRTDDRALQGFLAVENVIENNVDLQVKEITEDAVKVYISGKVRAEVDTAITEMQVLGVAILDRKNESVSALRVTIDEKRQISQLAPGFSGQVKLDVRTSSVTLSNPEIEKFRQVSGQKIAQLPLKLLWHTESQFELVYDPQWRVIVSDPDAVILRYVNNGNLLAQCSILRLPKRPADKPLQKAQFAEEITKMVAESQARVVSSDVGSTQSGLNVIRVVVQGEQDDLPVQWRYYHVSNPDGRCVAMVFTAEQESARQFGSADSRLIESVRFPPPETKPEGRNATASPAEPASSSRR